MFARILFAAAVVTSGFVPVLADEVLYQYEGDVYPYDPSAGWLIADPCEDRCTETVDTENGHFVLEWPEVGGVVNYHYWIAEPPDEPPSSLWVEWRFRSNTPRPPWDYGCDGRLSVHYAGIHEVVYVHGDSVVSFSGDDVVDGLDINEFHTYRFESLDGVNYQVSVDGLVFIVGADDSGNGYHYLQFSGEADCYADLFPAINEWDFIRYGTISDSEEIVASSPPSGSLDPVEYAGLDRFTVTFDAPNYLFITDITAETMYGDPPVILQTRRGESNSPDTVEIVLDRPLTLGVTTTFTFNTARGNNVVQYTLGDPIPTVSEWGLVVMMLLVLAAGTLVLRRRYPPYSQAGRVC